MTAHQAALRIGLSRTYVGAGHQVEADDEGRPARIVFKRLGAGRPFQLTPDLDTAGNIGIEGFLVQVHLLGNHPGGVAFLLRQLFRVPVEARFLWRLCNARVLQIPTPRYSLLDSIALGIDWKETNRPATIQERVYSSPIWCSP